MTVDMNQKAAVQDAIGASALLGDAADQGKTAASWDVAWSAVTAPSLFASAAWLEAWARWFNNDVTERFEVVRVGGQTVGLLPLVKRRGVLGLRYLGMPTGIVTPRSAIALTEAGAEAVATALVRVMGEVEAPVLVTGRLADDGALQHLAAHGHQLRIRQRYALPVIDATIDWSDYVASRSRNLRYSLAKAPKRLRPIVIERAATGPALENVLEAIHEVSRQTWKHEAGTSMAAAPAAFGFFRAVLSAADREGRLLVILARDPRTLPATPVGFLFSVRCGDTLYALKTGYVEALAAHGIGASLLAATIQEALADSAVRRLDLDAVAGGADYKLRWATSVEQLLTAWVFAPGVRGALLNRAVGTARRARKVDTEAPPAWNA